MKVSYKYLDELKILFNGDYLYRNSFIDFIDGFNSLYPKLKEEINQHFIKLDTIEFDRYSQHFFNELKNLQVCFSEEKSIDKWFMKYNMAPISVESIFRYDKNWPIFHDLSIAVCELNTYLADEIYLMQQDFLKVSKTYLLSDVRQFLGKLYQITNKKLSKKKHLEEAWFWVGLLFATGEIYALKEEHITFSEIARQKFPENPSKFRPYISDSFGGHTKAKKNIFNNLIRLNIIKTHCENNEITMSQKFLNSINSLQSKL
ncbi:hypothetical protein [Aestuariivivens sediminis]|uniref:hypothetical protein n=1 Tax=Aestuariivivens sediminis TaxID=2913557 RepID=UPI001F589BAD|nr:hypothetical protein [Aestuariivivens sediminis]